MITISGSRLLAYAKMANISTENRVNFTVVFNQQGWRIPVHPFATCALQS